MRNLLNFILKYSTWFVFLFYVCLSIALLIYNRRHVASVYLTSANSVSSALYGISNNVTGYFNLRSINNSLQQSNAILENEVLNLREELAYYKALTSDYLEEEKDSVQRFDFVLATVLNNSVGRQHNYFTINRGLSHGVKPGMGVIDQNGVLGIVNVSGQKTSRVISLLNTTQRLSSRLKGSQTIGTLVWKGNDPSVAYLEEVPRHAVFHVGDTVVTSGYSTSFPADITVGTVMGRVRSFDDNFYILKIKLAGDFNALSSVRVLKDNLKEELDSLVNYDL